MKGSTFCHGLVVIIWVDSVAEFFFSHRFVSQFNNFVSLMLLIPFLVLQFLSRIHIGPTQGHYSDVLPTPCTAKMNSLKPRVEYIRLYPLDQPESCSNGSPSHIGGGPTTEKAWWVLPCASTYEGTRSIPRSGGGRHDLLYPG